MDYLGVNFVVEQDG
jgi:hypothetical protein